VAQLSDPILPHEVIRDRAPALNRALRKLPEDLLQSLVETTESNLDNLVWKKLLTPDGAGCVVGHLLQSLDPDEYRPGSRIINWRRRQRWEREIARRHPRLSHIELTFDRCVQLARAARPDLSECELTRAAGIWISVEAQAELARRRIPRGLGLEDHDRRPDSLLALYAATGDALRSGANSASQC
jgi:hypothetical protein